MTEVVALFGGPTGERQREQHAVDVLEGMLVKAEAGEIVGVIVCAIHHDGLSSYRFGGRLGGYSLLGALDMAKADVMDIVRDA